MSIVSVSMHRIRHKVQFTTHKNSSQSQCCTERNKIWSSHFPFPWRPCALIICQSDRCFSNDGVSCVLNFYQSPTVRDCQTLYTIWWWKPPRTESLCCEAPFFLSFFTAGKANNRGRGCQGGLLRGSQHLTELQRARTRAGGSQCGTRAAQKTSESTAKIRSSELNFSERCEYVWVAEANIIYSRDININIDRKQICKWLCQCSLPQTEHKEGGHFAMCIF